MCFMFSAASSVACVVQICTFVSGSQVIQSVQQQHVFQKKEVEIMEQGTTSLCVDGGNISTN
uniref:Secreted protein n=1 Tax=Arundo donax TaxID=35708 RepID=A0A0A9B363_ARUDO